VRPPLSFSRASRCAHADGVAASSCSGVYLLRGSDANAIFEVAPDAESYSFEPLDWVKDREFITGAWTWEHTVDGKEYADGKGASCSPSG